LAAPNSGGIKLKDVRIFKNTLEAFKAHMLDSGQPPTLVAADPVVGITPEERALHEKATAEWHKAAQAKVEEKVEVEIGDVQWALVTSGIENFEFPKGFANEAEKLGDAFGIKF
jgi:hypothetical protein